MPSPSDDRWHLEYDARAVGWTPEEVVQFRHCYALMCEDEGIEQLRLSGSQFALFNALSKRSRGDHWPMPPDIVQVPRSLARFLNWWIRIEGVSTLYLEEFDWPRAAFIYVTDSEQRRAWQAAVALADKLDVLFAYLPRKR